MKKTLSLILVILMIFTLTSCAAQKDVTLPASFFEGMTEDEITAQAKESGYKKCSVNEDGSVVYTMSEKQYRKTLDDYRAQVSLISEQMLKGENAVPSFMKISYNDTLTQFDVFVDPAKYSAWEGLHAISFYMIGGYYQIFSGTPENEVDVILNFINNNTGEIIETGSYRDFLDLAAEEN